MTNEGLDGRNLEEYIPSTIGSSTHRKLTEKDGLKIDLPNARAATQEMRRRLDVVFHDFSDVSFQTINWDSPDLIRTSYVNSLTNTPDGETIDKSKALEQYLQVNTKNHSGAIKEMIEASYEPLSIPRTFVNLMNYYEDSLSVTGQDAAIMTLRLLIEYLPLISVLAEAKGKNISELDASRDAFRSIESLMPSHIEDNEDKCQ